MPEFYVKIKVFGRESSGYLIEARNEQEAIQKRLEQLGAEFTVSRLSPVNSDAQ